MGRLGLMDLSPHRDGLPFLRLAQRLQMATVFITPWHEMQQIVVGQEAQLGKQLRALRPNARVKVASPPVAPDPAKARQSAQVYRWRKQSPGAREDRAVPHPSH